MKNFKSGKKQKSLIDDVVTVGFPRSGNVFVNHYIHHAYETEDLLRPRHTVKSLKEFEHIVFPIRNPIDAMASYVVDDFDIIPVEQTIAFYLRFMEGALENKSKLCIVDFDIFVNDINHISNQINIHYNVPVKYNKSEQEIKEIIRSKNWTNNLPRDNKDKLAKAKEVLLNTNKIDECLQLYKEFSIASKNSGEPE